PEAGLLMIMGIDTFLDMGRSATNVIGNSLATAVVAKWEGELGPEHGLGPGGASTPDMVAGRATPLAGPWRRGHMRPSTAISRGLVSAACLRATGASAESGSEGLSPTLSAIKNAHPVRLGSRESSPPFSFLDQSGRPIGYSLELCEAIVEEIGVEVDDPNLRIEHVKVTSDDRIQAVTENKIDLECGSTTANAQRAKLAP